MDNSRRDFIKKIRAGHRHGKSQEVLAGGKVFEYCLTDVDAFITS